MVQNGEMSEIFSIKIMDYKMMSHHSILKHVFKVFILTVLLVFLDSLVKLKVYFNSY